MMKKKHNWMEAHEKDCKGCLNLIHFDGRYKFYFDPVQ